MSSASTSFSSTSFLPISVTSSDQQTRSNVKIFVLKLKPSLVPAAREKLMNEIKNEEKKECYLRFSYIAVVSFIALARVICNGKRRGESR
jgi:hypothetical protein